MPFYAVLRPGVGDDVRVIEDSPEGPQLLVDLGGAYLSVQVDRSDPTGAELAAVFARQIAAGAMRFARCCEGDEDDEASDNASNTAIDQEAAERGSTNEGNEPGEDKRHGYSERASIPD